MLSGQPVGFSAPPQTEGALQLIQVNACLGCTGQRFALVHYGDLCDNTVSLAQALKVMCHIQYNAVHKAVSLAQN